MLGTDERLISAERALTQPMNMEGSIYSDSAFRDAMQRTPGATRLTKAIAYLPGIAPTSRAMEDQGEPAGLWVRFKPAADRANPGPGEHGLSGDESCWVQVVPCIRDWKLKEYLFLGWFSLVEHIDSDGASLGDALAVYGVGMGYSDVYIVVGKKAIMATMTPIVGPDQPQSEGHVVFTDEGELLDGIFTPVG